MTPLQQAAQALVDRWDTPLWKDVPHTGKYIDALRAALAASPAMTEAEERAAFEARDEFKEDELLLQRRETGEYQYTRIQGQWVGWMARAALSVPAAPAGYKLVPIEPTPEMLDAAVQEICYGPEGGFTRIAGPSRAWRVMLAAAPSPQEPK